MFVFIWFPHYKLHEQKQWSHYFLFSLFTQSVSELLIWAGGFPGWLEHRWTVLFHLTLPHQVKILSCLCCLGRGRIRTVKRTNGPGIKSDERKVIRGERTQLEEVWEQTIKLKTVCGGTWLFLLIKELSLRSEPAWFELEKGGAEHC